MEIGQTNRDTSGLTSATDSPVHGDQRLKLEFDAVTPEGTVRFVGNLSADEVTFLLKIAIQGLMASGLMAVSTPIEDKGTLQ